VKANFENLIAALQASRTKHDDAGLTLREMSKRAGKCEDWIRKRLHEARDEGRLVFGRREIQGIDGRRAFATVYSFKKVKKGLTSG
jgi:hypothetical protein